MNFINFFDNYNISIKFNEKNKVNFVIIISFINLLLFFSIDMNLKYYENYEYQQDNITIVSAYYKIKSKYKPANYLNWIHNFLMINKSMVFFTNRRFIWHLKSLRPKEFHNKTVFIEVEMEKFYSYINFIIEFKKSFEIDFEKKYHTVPLYLIWAEKCNFMKTAITKNYFNSKCFYWVDAGYFRDKNEIIKYSNGWPSIKKCYEDKRLLMGQVKYFSPKEREKILKFDSNEHIKLRKNINVIGGIFGGQKENILKFIYLYYQTLKLFIKKGIFIGKDQNIFTYIAFAYPEIVKLVLFKDYMQYKKYIY